MGKTKYGYVLVVEDLAFMRRLLSGIIKSLGYEIREAESGLEAITMMKQQPPVLVFLDIVMPKMSGLEVCQWIRKNKATAGVPVIICTAQQERRDLEAAVRAGATDFLLKPVDRRTLKQRLDKYLPLPEDGKPPQG